MADATGSERHARGKGHLRVGKAEHCTIRSHKRPIVRQEWRKVELEKAQKENERRGVITGRSDGSVCVSYTGTAGPASTSTSTGCLARSFRISVESNSSDDTTARTHWS